MLNWLKQWFSGPEEETKPASAPLSSSTPVQRSSAPMVLGTVGASVPTPNTTEAVNSRSNACNRLRLVLLHDRTQLEPSVLDAMREELVQVISKYVSIEKDRIEINLETDPNTNTVALVANIPVRSSRGQESLPPEDTKTTQASSEVSPVEEISSKEPVTSF
jgi:cell division topological specificity factor